MYANLYQSLLEIEDNSVSCCFGYEQDLSVNLVLLVLGVALIFS